MQEEKSSRAQDGERERPLSLKRTTCLRFVRVSGSEITLQPRRLLPNRSFSPTGVLQTAAGLPPFISSGLSLPPLLRSDIIPQPDIKAGPVGAGERLV
ncbi:hypothetical protein FQA47_008961 [Oryzias melastigma]|uniref:Uncharacterized protein n=1 Tax=Oryzias melastigma TaxID=30732 RepID=A0A834FE04_ORYME|nr:hypothetical protein FQA47_008961 [Oryzias melastigma]